MKLLELIKQLQAAHEKTGDVEVRAYDHDKIDGTEIDCVTVAGRVVFIDEKVSVPPGRGAL